MRRNDQRPDSPSRSLPNGRLAAGRAADGAIPPVMSSSSVPAAEGPMRVDAAQGPRQRGPGRWRELAHWPRERRRSPRGTASLPRPDGPSALGRLPWPCSRIGVPSPASSTAVVVARAGAPTGGIARRRIAPHEPRCGDVHDSICRFIMPRLRTLRGVSGAQHGNCRVVSSSSADFAHILIGAPGRCRLGVEHRALARAASRSPQ